MLREIYFTVVWYSGFPFLIRSEVQRTKTCRVLYSTHRTATILELLTKIMEALIISGRRCPASPRYTHCAKPSTADDEIEGVLENDMTRTEGVAAPNIAPRSAASLAMKFYCPARFRMKFVSKTSHWA